MEYAVLILIHLVGAIVWGGAVVMVGLFLVPSLKEAGPAAGAVMGGIVKRKFPVVMGIMGVLVVLTGLRLYMLRFSTAWLTTAEGIVLSLGGLLGIGAFAIGMAVQKPTTEKLAALGEQIRAAGGPPTAEQQAQIAALQAKLARTAKILAFHVLGATLLMASHRLATLAN